MCSGGGGVYAAVFMIRKKTAMTIVRKMQSFLFLVLNRDGSLKSSVWSKEFVELLFVSMLVSNSLS